MGEISAGDETDNEELNGESGIIVFFGGSIGKAVLGPDMVAVSSTVLTLLFWHAPLRKPGFTAAIESCMFDIAREEQVIWGKIIHEQDSS